jgi:hypothetical protein
MLRGITLFSLLIVSLPCFGQIGIGIPGMGYPGRRYPQGGQQPMPRQQPDNQSPIFVGILRKLDDKTVIVEDDDQKITTLSISGSTKYINDKGYKATSGDFQPGDRVSVDSKAGNNNSFKALKVTMVSAGTAEEHSAASAAMSDPTKPLPGRTPVNSTSESDNPNRPVLRRAGSNSGASDPPPLDDNGGHPTLRRAGSASGDASDSSSNDNNPDRPVLRRASSASGSGDAPPSSSGSDSDRPRLRRADDVPPPAPAPASSSGSYDTSDNTPAPRTRRAVSSGDETLGAQIPSASATPSSASSDSGGYAGPQLRRAPSVDTTGAASDGRPSLRADDRGSAARIPQRMPSTDDPFIDDAREAAFSFSETLPNYVVKQYTTRYATMTQRNGRSTWQTLDTVTADVLEVDNHEQYKNILVNGKPPVRDVERSGSWSKGEFSSLMQDVMSPMTDARFRNKQAVTIVNRPAFRYEFSVEQENSHWHIEAESQAYMPAYTGSIWIDKETHRVLRIEMSAQRMPGGFPLDQVEWAIDYDFVAIGEGRYLLPAHSETLSCARSGRDCTRNTIEFRNYRKFTADSSITFDTDK